MTPAKLNESHRRFYANQAVVMDQRLADRLLADRLLTEVNKDNARCSSFRDRRTVEEILFSFDEHGTAVLKRQAAKGGRADKADELTKFIRARVAEKPNIGVTEMLKMLRDDPSSAGIDDATAVALHLRDGKTIKISGLKDRLSRAKKQFSETAER